jgi:hypothetical protein
MMHQTPGINASTRSGWHFDKPFGFDAAPMDVAVARTVSLTTARRTGDFMWWPFARMLGGRTNH